MAAKHFCGVCSLEIEVRDEFMCSSGCSNLMHLKCAGVDEIVYRKSNKARKDKFRCIDCVNSTDSALNKSSSHVSDENTSEILLTENNGNVSISSLGKAALSEIKTCILETINPTILKIESMCESIEFIGKSIDSMQQEIVQIKKIESDHNLCLADLNKKNQTLKSEIDFLRSKIDDLEQDKLKLNIELVGLPQQTLNNLQDSILKIASVIGYEGTETFGDCYVIKGTKESLSDSHVIVKFTDYSEKISFIKLAKKYKSLTTGIFDTVKKPVNIYVNDHLSRSNKYLLYMAKQFKKQNPEIQFAWSNGGKVLMRRNEQSKIVRIYSIADFKLLLNA